jgi:predicted nucleic acid-binding protein
VRIAIELSERFAISYWDAAIIAAADSLGAKVVHSQDLIMASAMDGYGSFRDRVTS